MLLLDTILRISAATMLCLTAVFALKDARHLLQAKIAAALCISLSAMLIRTMPEAMGSPPWLDEVSWLLHLPNTVLIWWFGLSLYEDDFKLAFIHWVALFATIGLLLFMVLADNNGWDTANYVCVILNRVVGFSILGHLFWTAIAGRKNDLVETRRRTRLWFVAGTALTALIVISAETAHFLASGNSSDPDWLSTMRTAIVWPMIFFGTLWFLSMKPEQLLFETVQPASLRKPEIDPKDAATHRKLLEVMENGAYTEAGLTIGTLAEKISVPEHQLRALINQGLGFRNFAAFLNSYRISFAKRLLTDPEKARLPILSIAMDAGYNSLATFNRAFKAIDGRTPTEFRKTSWANSDQS